jgi:small GTP-binding protein
MAAASGDIKVVDNKPDDARKPVKVILLGDSAVGKSKLVERFLMQRYVPIQMSTYALTLFKYDIIADGQEIDCDFWDTAGQERFATMHPAYYHDAHCCILVFDVTRKPTYKNLEKWLGELRAFRPHIPCLVACNKIDTDPEIVTQSFAFAEKHNLPLHYVSAADGTNVVQLFRTAIDLAAKYRANPLVEDIESQVLNLLKEKKAEESA